MKALLAKAPSHILFKMGVVCPTNEESLRAPVLAAQQGVITPVFIGPLSKMKQAADAMEEDISRYECVDMDSEEDAANYAVKLAKEGELNALMKGNIHTDMLMAKVVHRDSGLRQNRRMSHVMLTDIPSYHKLVIFSDVALNIEPTLQDKRDIVQTAIDFALSLGIQQPKVALLSSVDVPSEKVKSSMDCLALCQMAERGEIRHATLMGPIQFDSAISRAVANVKKIDSPVAGDPDIMIVPTLDVGNIVIKALEICADSACYGLILGAKIPIILLSRAASAESRVGSCLLAKFFYHYIGK